MQMGPVSKDDGQVSVSVDRDGKGSDMNHMTRNERSTQPWPEQPCKACRPFPNPNLPLLTAAHNSRAVFTGPWRFVRLTII